ERGRLHDARLRLLQGTRAQARLRGQLLAKLAERFSSQRFALALQRRGGRLVDLAARAAALHPQATLRRGFALIRDADGRTVRDAGALAAGARIAATVARGRIEATVVKSERDGTANEERR
ncbi:MAG: hypothetical protein FJ293_14800, partial [Planctomycetes bacterium]|nr:hypothetical protein [Planctomycetota bacterium]